MTQDKIVQDHVWLAKVKTALEEYSLQHPCEKMAAEVFVRWLYKQYGYRYDD